jgi:DNA-binding NtrC family response regulator
MISEISRAQLGKSEFHVIWATNIRVAIRLIDTESFDPLPLDLCMAGAGNGVADVSAMQHEHPQASTLLLTGPCPLEGGDECNPP